MIPAGPLFHKPKSIIAARNILYTALFLEALVFIFQQVIGDTPLIRVSGWFFQMGYCLYSCMSRSGILVLGKNGHEFYF